MTISPPQNRVTYWEGKIRGIQDARLLADGLMPRGAGKPAGYPNNSYHLGYADGLSAPVTSIQRASSAASPPERVPWRQQRRDNEHRSNVIPGPWQLREVRPVGGTGQSDRESQ